MCPLTDKQLTLSRHKKVKKIHCQNSPSAINHNNMKQREYLKKKEWFYSTIRLLCVNIATFWRVSAGRCSVSAAPHRYVFYVCSMCPCGTAYTEQRTQFASSGYSPKWRKYYRRFVMLRLNHWWWQMDYSDDVFYTFLCLDRVNCLAVNGTVTSLPSNMEVET